MAEQRMQVAQLRAVDLALFPSFEPISTNLKTLKLLLHAAGGG